MSLLDGLVVAAYFILILFLGFYYQKKSKKNIEEYFLSGRQMPWWLAGVSMAATTFAADTPLAVTGIVAKDGVAGNWLWWNFAFSGIMTVFFFAAYWRNSGVMTDAEIAELRYGGRAAKFLRGFRAVYLAVPINLVIMGWVTVGMSKVIEAAFGWPKWEVIIILYLITGLYIIFSGLWGVVMADFFQFIVAMTGSVILMIYGLDYVDGIDGLKLKLIEKFGVDHELLSISPFASGKIVLSTVLTWICLQWWASWYPGAEPGGGGYVAQRMFSTKSGKDAVYSTLFFNLAHYGIRPWPWIIVGLISMVVFTDIGDPEMGYPLAMKKFLPSGFLGLLSVAFFSAFMSTISTHLNWGASYLVNDVYKRFMKPDKSDKHYVWISRGAVFFLMASAMTLSYFFDSVKGAWELLLSLGAGTGLVYLLRWYWHRINAYSEISAMIAAFIGSIVFNLAGDFSFADKMIYTTIFTSAVWLSVTFLTKPESTEILKKFAHKVNVHGPGWKHYVEDEKTSIKYITDKLSLWILGVVLVYSFLFGVGKFIFKDYVEALIFLFLFLVSAILLNKKMKNISYF
ncbi:MAG: Na+:solute symporter [Spirochaetia bacterium]|nr:Na+:solute symporter [Spirochaetia bacterium]